MVTDYKFKICLVGEPAVGKTSLVKRFVYNVFSDFYLTTIGTNVYKKTVNVNGKKVDLIIWDIMGQETFRQILCTAYFYGAEALIAVGDLTREDTFIALPEWKNAALRVVKKEMPVVLLANKSDLEWTVSEDTVNETGHELSADATCITSAKTGENVNEAFIKVAELLLKNRNS